MPIFFKRKFEDVKDTDFKENVSDFLDDSDDDTVSPPSPKRRRLNNDRHTTPQKKKNQSTRTQKSSKSVSNHSKATSKKSKVKKKKTLPKEHKPKKSDTVTTKTTLGKVSLFSSALPLVKDIVSLLDSGEGQAQYMERMFLLTLKLTVLEFNFKFQATHFQVIPKSSSIQGYDSPLDGLYELLKTRYEIDSSAYNGSSSAANSRRTGDTGVPKKKLWEPSHRSMKVMVLSPSIKRSIDVIKYLKGVSVYTHSSHSSNGGKTQYIRVMALFGKHRKLKEQRKELDTRTWHAGVGGISRIRKLCDSKDLVLDDCDLLVLDLHRDVKELTFLDSPVQREELCQFMQTYAMDRIEKGLMKICFLV